MAHALISVFNDKINVKLVSKNLQSLAKHMKDIAVEYVQDSIGKNNYIDTLTSEYAALPVQKCPHGYVLKLNDNKLTVYFHNTTPGYIYTSHSVTTIGYYSIVPVAEIDGDIKLNTKTAIGESHIDPEVRKAWGNLGSDLFKFIKQKSEHSVQATTKLVNEVVISDAAKPQPEQPEQKEQPKQKEQNPTSEVASERLTSSEPTIIADYFNAKTIVNDNLQLTAQEVVSSVTAADFKKELVERALSMQAKLNKLSI